MVTLGVVFFYQGKPRRGLAAGGFLLVMVPQTGEWSFSFLKKASTSQHPPQWDRHWSSDVKDWINISWKGRKKTHIATKWEESCITVSFFGILENGMLVSWTESVSLCVPPWLSGVSHSMLISNDPNHYHNQHPRLLVGTPLSKYPRTDFNSSPKTRNLNAKVRSQNHCIVMCPFACEVDSPLCELHHAEQGQRNNLKPWVGVKIALAS